MQGHECSRRMAAAMAQPGNIGILAMVEAGEPRVRPMEFVYVDGELWAAASRRSLKLRGLRDGQHVDVLLIDELLTQDRVRGYVHCSTRADDRQRLWALQQCDIAVWCQGEDDPDFIVLKIIPDDEYGHGLVH